MIIPNLDFGGAQRSFTSLANALSKSHNVTIVVFNTMDGISFPLIPEVVDLRIPGGNSFLEKGLLFWRRCNAVTQLKKRLNIDSTISYLEGANYINALSGKDRRILSVRGSKYHDENIKGLLGWLRRRILIPIIFRRATYIVALNNGIKTELTERCGINSNRVEVIRNFYDINRLRSLAQLPLSTPWQFLEQRDYLIYTGRLATGKGVLTIIDMFCLMKKTNNSLLLVLIGDGPLKQETIRHARLTGLNVFCGDMESNVSVEEADLLLLGYQDNPYQFISNAKMLMLASTSEGGPNALMESLICGTLVAAADCPYGPSELLAPELDGVPVTKVTPASRGILLPMIEKQRREEGLRQWSTGLSGILKDHELQENILAGAEQLIVKHSSEHILRNWERIA